MAAQGEAQEDSDVNLEMTESERRVLGWICEYLLAGPSGSVRQCMYGSIYTLMIPGAPLEKVEFGADDGAFTARLMFNTLDAYGEDDLALCDFADPADLDDDEDTNFTSWRVLEDDNLPTSWDRGPSSDLFKVCLELRTQAVLHHCRIDDGSFHVDAAGWAAALATAFKPMDSGDKETTEKNRLLKKRREQLEEYMKPAKKAALKQFAVNHLRTDAEDQLHALIPKLAEHFPPTFLDQVDANRERVSGAAGTTAGPAAAAAPTAAAGPAPVAAAAVAAAPAPAEVASAAAPTAASTTSSPSNSTPARQTRSAARTSAQRAEESDEEVLEDQEVLDIEQDNDEAPPPRRQRKRRDHKIAASEAPAAATSSPANRSLRRSSRKSVRCGSHSNSGMLSASTVASAGLPSRVIGLNELRDASGLGPTEFLQIWNQQHPEVRSWLDMVEGGDDSGQTANSAATQSVDADEASEEIHESQESLSDTSNRPQQLRDLKAESARLKSLGGDDPLAASLAAGPNVDNGFGFAAPASRRSRRSAAATGGASSNSTSRGKGRFDRSPLFNKPTANAVKHVWDEDEDEDKIEDGEEENAAQDPFAYDADQSMAARLESPRSGKLAPLNNRHQEQLPTSRSGRSASVASSASKKRVLPSSSRKAHQSSSGGNASRGRKKYKRWTDEETQNLREGVDRWGTKWAKILQSYEFNDRSGVDLKDRWRNLCKNE